MTLRRYFLTADIVGSEVHKNRLETCRALNLGKGVTFIDASRRSLTESGPFDAIFCMAVLQRIPHTVIDADIRHLQHLYPFEMFDV